MSLKFIGILTGETIQIKKAQIVRKQTNNNNKSNGMT